jgi:antitoxin component YwqK of YwqJK toxin-antitoxin module
MVDRRAVASGRAACTGRCRRVRLFVSLSILLIATLAAPTVAAAYGNPSAHPEINKLAVRAFEARAAADEWLGGTEFGNGKVSGIAVTEPGLLQIKEEERAMTVAEWIAHGGMSADEPELPASFRHFYDPLANSGVSYLTDHLDDVIEWSGTLGKALIQTAGYFMPALDTKNPQIDARTWALTHPDNRYSYANGIKYFGEALAAQVTLGADGQPVRTNAKYGMAWRAVGETMHLVADMTVPAHVRNDSHPDVDVRVTKIGNSDPYESTIGASEIAANAGGSASSSIDYGAEDLAQLFDSVARWTNANFYSGDTIQSGGLLSRTANGELAYRSPGVPATEGNYFYREIDGAKTPILATSLLRKFGLLVSSADSAIPVGTLDWQVLQSQRQLLIPTAIEASSRVLDNFLPRFKAEFKVEQTGAKSFEIKGALAHSPTKVWPSAPTISNGAFIRYKPQDSPTVQVIWLPRESYESGNKVKHTLEVAPGGVVSLHWDLGGYVITTTPTVLGGAELRVSSTGLSAALVKRPVKLEATITEIPAELKTVKVEWTYGDGSSPETATVNVADFTAFHLGEHTYQASGEYTINTRVLHPTTGAPLAEASNRAVVREVKVQIYPNSISGKTGFPVEASCLPAESYYRYEWSYGDGQTVADGKTAVKHTYAAPGAYDLTVRIYDRNVPGPALAEATIKVQIEGQQGVCPLCGHVHGPLERIENARTIRYADAEKQRQCVYQEYWDDAKTKLRIVSIFVDNLREGMVYEYYEDGVLKYETPYVGGKRQGMQSEYNYLGQLTIEREYKDDRADGLYIGYYNTGSKSTTGNYVYFAETKMTQQHGYWVSWHENGVKSNEGEYDRGLRIGTWRYYYQSGQLEILGTYAAGKTVGTWTWYNTKGEVMRTYTY